MATWIIDSTHTSVNFSVKHLVISTVRGSFSNASGTIEFDPANPAASSVDASIDATTVTTGVADRDGHLRSPDFFNVEQYPTLTFKSTQLELANNTSGKLHGDLTIAGTTKPVTFDVEFLGQAKSPFGKDVVSFSASTKINREDFGLNWNQALETGGWLVSQDVKIELEVQANPA